MLFLAFLVVLYLILALIVGKISDVPVIRPGSQSIGPLRHTGGMRGIKVRSGEDLELTATMMEAESLTSFKTFLDDVL